MSATVLDLVAYRARLRGETVRPRRHARMAATGCRKCGKPREVFGWCRPCLQSIDIRMEAHRKRMASVPCANPACGNVRGERALRRSDDGRAYCSAPCFYQGLVDDREKANDR